MPSVTRTLVTNSALFEYLVAVHESGKRTFRGKRFRIALMRVPAGFGVARAH